MLNLNDPIKLQGFLNVQNSIGAQVNYLQDILLPAIMGGDYNKLKNLVIYQDSKLKIYFNDDEWMFLTSDFQGKSPCNIYFTISEVILNEKVKNIHLNNIRNIINEMKVAVLARMYFTSTKITLKTISGTLNTLRIIAREMLKRSLASFSNIDTEELNRWRLEGYDFTSKHAFTGLNMLVEVSGLLPFTINFNKLTHKIFNIEKAIQKQYTVIPPRIYFAILNKASKEIQNVYKNKHEIELAVIKMLSIESYEMNNRIRNYRLGDDKLNFDDLKKVSVKKFLAELEKRNILFLDYENNADWMIVYNEIKPDFTINSSCKSYFLVVGNEKYSWVNFKQYIEKLSVYSSWLCLLLSGMRCNELFNIHPSFGSQFNDIENEFNPQNKERIYLFTTLQSKITGNSQKKDDVYVTTDLGYKAFQILESIHSPIRKSFPASKKWQMFASLYDTKSSLPISCATSLGKIMRDHLIKHSGINFNLMSEDITYLNTSETNHTFKVRDEYTVTTHQARRSLAYYLIGYELCSFPALKQQLGHFSMAMTRWYARNASSYHGFWQEVENERVSQQASIYTRIFQRLANGERIAGGKGKTYLNTIANTGNDYFEEGVNKRLLSVEYWKESIRTKKEHLHAIAPGMYCTNNKCEMRISIDLTECVSCEYDYIENVVYAESSRMNAMVDLNMLIENNELNASSASRCYMKIKAAEHIMKDLDFNFDPYKFSNEVENMVILTKQVTDE